MSSSLLDMNILNAIRLLIRTLEKVNMILDDEMSKRGIDKASEVPHGQSES